MTFPSQLREPSLIWLFGTIKAPPIKCQLTNGVIYSPGTRIGEDKGNFGTLGDTETWFIRPTSGLLKRSNIFNRGGRTRRTPLTKLYTAVRAEDFNLNLSASRGRPVIP